LDRQEVRGIFPGGGYWLQVLYSEIDLTNLEANVDTGVGHLSEDVQFFDLTPHVRPRSSHF
jgi:hypothetical protein